MMRAVFSYANIGTQSLPRFSHVENIFSSFAIKALANPKKCDNLTTATPQQGNQPTNSEGKQMSEKIAVWNTGAHYSENGQRIAATIVEGGIVFLDIDRGIDGLIPLANIVRDLRAQAQHGYDYGNYVSAWEHSDTLKQLAAGSTPKANLRRLTKRLANSIFLITMTSCPQSTALLTPATATTPAHLSTAKR